MTSPPDLRGISVNIDGVDVPSDFLGACAAVRTARQSATFWGATIDLRHPALRARAWAADQLEIATVGQRVVVSWPGQAPSNACPPSDGVAAAEVRLRPKDRLVMKTVRFEATPAEFSVPTDREYAIATLSVLLPDGSETAIESPLILYPSARHLDPRFAEAEILTFLRERLADLRQRPAPPDDLAAVNLADAILNADRAATQIAKLWPDAHAMLDDDAEPRDYDSVPNPYWAALAAGALAGAAAQLGYAVGRAEAAYSLQPAASDGVERRDRANEGVKKAAEKRTIKHRQTAAQEVWAKYPNYTANRVAGIIARPGEDVRSIALSIGSSAPKTSSSFGKYKKTPRKKPRW